MNNGIERYRGNILYLWNKVKKFEVGELENITNDFYYMKEFEGVMIKESVFE